MGESRVRLGKSRIRLGVSRVRLGESRNRLGESRGEESCKSRHTGICGGGRQLVEPVDSIKPRLDLELEILLEIKICSDKEAA